MARKSAQSLRRSGNYKQHIPPVPMVDEHDEEVDGLEEPSETEDTTDPDPDQDAPPRAGRSTLGVVWTAAGVVWVLALALIVYKRSQTAEPIPTAALVGDSGQEEDSSAPKAASTVAPAQTPSDQDDNSSPPRSAKQQEDVEASYYLPRKWYRSDWDEGLKIPEQVRYTIRRGGSMENVANLYKIYHHEIQALNPGVDLKANLKPQTKLVIHRGKGSVGESIGFPGDGSLAEAVPMIEGPGRELRMVPWKSFATGSSVALLDKILRTWAQRFPDAKPLLVGNMSSREGGRLRPHSSHQSGRDVDLSYPQKIRAGEEYNWREMTAENLDAGKTWELLRILAETEAVELVFIDTGIQKLLHKYALEKELVPPSSLRRWLSYGSKGGKTFVQHHKGHVDHIHVRFACLSSQARCKSRSHT